MFSCSCEIGQYIYRLSTTRSSFNGASTTCRNEGGRLARFLTRSDYKELNSCCSQNGEYWIGLVDRGDCPENAPYRWDTTSTCKSAAPLAFTAQPNNSGCQGVTIITAGSQRNLPMARGERCDQFQQFICQYLPLSTTRAVTTEKSVTTRAISRTSTTTTTARRATTASFSSTQLFLITSSFSVTFDTSPNTIDKNTQSETNAAIISSIILGIIILLLLLANLCYWRYKKSESAQMRNCSATSEQPMPSLVPVKQTHSSKRNQEHLCQKYV